MAVKEKDATGRVCLSVTLCVRETESERERERGGKRKKERERERDCPCVCYVCVWSCVAADAYRQSCQWECHL